MYATKRLGQIGLGLLLAASVAACGLEGVDNSDVRRIAHSDSTVNERLDNLGIICETLLTVTGTHTPTDAQPADFNGCWEVGVWTVTSQIDFLGCSPQEPLQQEYIYTITRDDDQQTEITYNGDFDTDRMNLKVTSAGDGLCHASFEHFRADGIVFTFKPTLQEDGSLLGIGAYSVWEEDPF